MNRMIAVVAVALLLIFSLRARAAEPSIATTAVVYEAAPRERLWDGRVEAVNQSTVSAQTAGRVAEVLYDIDDFVPAGSVIIRFTDTEQRAAVQQAEANLKEAQASAEEARKEFERVKELFNRKLVPSAELDRATARRDGAEARIESTRSAVTSARQQLDYTVVRAPYAGIVTARHIQVGESVTPGQSLMTGLSLETLRVNVDLPQSVIEAVRRIRTANVIAPDDPSRRIAVEKLTIFPYADAASNTFRVRLALPTGAAGLYPGMLVKAAFVIGDAKRLLIPASAVVQRSEVSGVYVLAEAGLSFRQVRVGNRFGERVEILAGLQQGENVAVDPVRAAQVLKERGANGG